MHIVIPMSGEGSRFVRAGYKDPKPLIKVNGKPIIEHVINMFPGNDKFTFICRKEHLANTDMREILLRLKPEATIIEMEGKKLGPVYAVMQAANLIDDEEPTIVNYCDFYMEWDYQDFKNVVAENGCDGALPVYTGFHPHLLHEKNLYASMRVDKDGYMEEIREKFSFSKNKMESYHSPGTHYFKKGKYVKKYFQQLMDENISLNGEYYVSLVYNLLKRDNLNTYVYDKISYFLQWGTPEDFEEYLYWSECFEMLGKEKFKI